MLVLFWQRKNDAVVSDLLHPPTSSQQHAGDRLSRDHHASLTTAAARCGTQERSGRRNERRNAENEVPDALSQHRYNLPPVQQQQRQEQSSWRKLKKLDHQHLHPRQISPSRAVGAPVAVVVESDPPPSSESGGGGGRPYKRTRKASTEEDVDTDSLTTSAHSSSRGSYNAYSGSPDSEASSRRRSVASSSPLSRAGLGFYLGARMVDSSPPSAAAAATAVTAATITTNSGCSSFTDHNQHHSARRKWDREQTSRAVGGAGGGIPDDEDAAAAAVLGLRNGHVSAAAVAAVAATQPPAVAVVGSKRDREAIEQAQAPLPAAVNIARAGRGAAGSATTTTHDGGDVAAGNSSAGALQWTGKR